MPKIRILVVDDSVVVRRMVSDALASDPQLEIAGTAANGKIALAKIPQVNPDIVILDVEMPELDGIGTLVGIRKSLPALPVIMYSTLTQRGAEATLEALSKGATDYVTKPSNVGSAAQGLECIRTQLIPKIKAICGRVLGLPAPSLLAATAASKAPPPRLAFPRREERIDIVAIGVSTGGPNALASLIPTFPRDFPVPVVIVQHMPPVFTRLLAERLAAKSQIGVEEGYPGAVLEPGCAWIAPGDYHMVVDRRPPSGDASHPPGPAGKLLPPGSGRAIPFGGRRLQTSRPCGGDDRDGPGWPAGLRTYSRVRRANPGAGSGDERRLGNARVCGQRRSGR